MKKPPRRSMDQIREDVQNRREKVALLTRQGVTAPELSHMLGVTTKTIVRDRAATGVIQPAARRYSPQLRQQIESMLDDGCSYSEVQRTTGVHSSALSKYWPGRGMSRSDGNRIRRMFKELEDLEWRR